VDNVSMTLAAINEIKSGGVGWGQGSSNTISLSPGQSTSVPAMAMGDAQGIQVVIRSGSGFTKALVAKSVHKKKIVADGCYRGAFKGQGISGSLQLTISGTSVRGVLTGSYTDPNQKIVNKAAITGSFDPETGAISASWSGMATGTMKVDGEKYNVNEPISGSFSGVYSKKKLAGNWSGGSSYISSSGQWSAQ